MPWPISRTNTHKDRCSTLRRLTHTGLRKILKRLIGKQKQTSAFHEDESRVMLAGVIHMHPYKVPESPPVHPVLGSSSLINVILDPVRF